MLSRIGLGWASRLAWRQQRSGPGFQSNVDRRHLHVGVATISTPPPFGERFALGLEQHGLLAELETELAEQLLQAVGLPAAQHVRRTVAGSLVGPKQARIGLPALRKSLIALGLGVCPRRYSRLGMRSPMSTLRSVSRGTISMSQSASGAVELGLQVGHAPLLGQAVHVQLGPLVAGLLAALLVVLQRPASRIRLLVELAP